MGLENEGDGVEEIGFAAFDAFANRFDGEGGDGGGRVLDGPGGAGVVGEGDPTDAAVFDEVLAEGRTERRGDEVGGGLVGRCGGIGGPVCEGEVEGARVVVFERQG